MTAETQSRAHWRRQALIWLTALLGFRLLALALNNTDLMFDEAQYWSWAKEPAFGYFSKPPLLAWVIGATTGVCGDAESCVRAGSPLLYWGAGLLLFFAAERLFDSRIAFWSAIVFSTVPGISFSSAITSTDVPLLFCWCAALLAWVQLNEKRSVAWFLMLGLAIGLGLNAKYAMAYFFLCMAVHLALVPSARWLLRDPRSLLLLVLPALCILPNMLWNADNGFITMSHTADNAKWGGALFHPDKGLKFFSEQFGVFGPVLFAVLLVALWKGVRGQLSERSLMLLHFSVPVVTLILIQALLSRAHANWAAVTYPAAAILVTEMLLREGRWRLFRASLALHLFLIAGIALANWAAPSLALPGRADPYKRVLGWEALGQAVSDEMRRSGAAALLTEDRWVAAELLYYLREEDFTLKAWRPGSHPRDHYELTRPFEGKTKGPYLLVTVRPSVGYVTEHFRSVSEPRSVDLPAGPKSQRTVRFYLLDGYSRK